MKHLLVLTGIIISIALLTACSASSHALKTGDITDENLSTVCSVLEEHGLHNVSTFKKWVEDTDSKGEQEDNDGFSDADCRMTVMLLAGDDIEYENVEESYDGTYLMFDMDVIDNNKLYGVLKEKQQLFTTLFGEMKIPEGGFDRVFTDNLKKHGIRFSGSGYSVISILFKAYQMPDAFVGHTGIRVPYGSGYMFIEKIAFSDPYRVTIVKDEEELLSVLSERPEYTVEPGEPAPLVYRDDEVIESLNKGS